MPPRQSSSTHTRWKRQRRQTSNTACDPAASRFNRHMQPADKTGLTHQATTAVSCARAMQKARKGASGLGHQLRYQTCKLMFKHWATRKAPQKQTVRLQRSSRQTQQDASNQQLGVTSATMNKHTKQCRKIHEQGQLGLRSSVVWRLSVGTGARPVPTQQPLINFIIAQV